MNRYWIPFVIVVVCMLAFLFVPDRSLRFEIGASDCVHLSNGFMPGQIVVINSRFMLCTALSESSVDVECREMKETPCVGGIGVRK